MQTAVTATEKPAPAGKPARQPRGNAALAAYARARQEAIARFDKNPRIEPLWRGLSTATDRLLQTAAGAGLSLIAVGGYGRRELFPYSDVDVLILMPEKQDHRHEEAIVRALQSLWDQQIPVSHATRSIDDTIALAGRDATVAAALMDARYLAGDRNQYLVLKRRLRGEVFGHAPRTFVEAKLAERDSRHARFGDSRFLLEPNIKEGKGALRDLQALNWLTRYCYGTREPEQVIKGDMLSATELKRYREAYLFFSTVRAQMHLLRGRADERLSFDLQPTIAKRLGFSGRTPQIRAERLMRRYFQYARAVGNITRMLCATLEEQQLRGQPAPFVQENVARQLPEYLRLENGRLDFSDEAELAKLPHQVIGLFAHAQQFSLDIHPRAQLALSRNLARMGQQLPKDEQSNALLLSIMLSPNAPDIALRRMGEMGVLAAIIPEFGRLSGQMQYDGYHTYTVDEHILVAIANLRQLELGNWSEELPLSTALASETHDRAVLFVSMLCHDIAKGTGGAHAVKGARIAQQVAARLGLSKPEREQVGWLVKHHALLTDTAFKRDLDDEKTIEDFVTTVQSPERLRLLVLITVADIKAVGPAIFNRWKGALMRTLYYRAMAVMGIGEDPAAPPPPKVIKQWRRHPGKAALSIEHDAFRAVTIVTICLTTQPRLFTALAGAISLMGASIVSARTRPLSEQAPGASLAEFHIQNLHGESFADDEKRLRLLPELIAQALEDVDAVGRKLASRKRVGKARTLPLRAGVFIDNQVSASASVIEINARDRIGLLYAMLTAMDACQLQVMTAHVATYGQLAVDVFYVKDAYGHKLVHSARQAQLKEALGAAIGVEEK